MTSPDSFSLKQWKYLQPWIIWVTAHPTYFFYDIWRWYFKFQVRTGRNTETFRTSGVYDQISEDCAFSIIYGEMYESLDLVANSAEVANIWVTGLRYDTTKKWELH